MTTDTNFIATGPGDAGVQVNGNVKVGVDATGTSHGGSFHLPGSTRFASAVTADNPLCNAALCLNAFNFQVRELFGIAVHGHSDKGEAIHGETDSGAGVVGEAKSGHAFFGSSVTGRGVFGQSSENDGIFGQTGSAAAAGVSGANLNGTIGFLAGNDHSFKQPTGVYGESTHQGVFGVSKGPVGTGIVGLGAQEGSNFDPNTGGKGVFGTGYIGVMGHTQTGVALLGKSFGPGKAGRFEGDVEVTGGGRFFGTVECTHGDPRLQETTIGSEAAQAGVFGASDTGAGVMGYSRNTGSFGVIAFGGIRASAMDHPLAGEFNGKVQVNGDVQLSGDIFLPGADCAEQFDVGEPIEPGTVVVIDQQGVLRQSRIAYDKKVAGVVSGAGTYRPGIILDKQEAPTDRLPVALVGKVYCKVDAQYSPIEVGDVLTSSPTAGHAMKAADPIRAFGAVIGKALRAWGEGSGLIPILVSLQ